MMTSGSMSKMLRKDQALIAHLFIMSMELPEEEKQTDVGILEVLDQHAEAFDEPRSLPPARTLDHSTLLKPAAMPGSLRT